MTQTLVSFHPTAAAAADQGRRLLQQGYRIAISGPADDSDLQGTGAEARDGPVDDRPFVLVATDAELETREPA